MDKNSYDIVGEAVEKFWDKNYPRDVIAFFEQRGDYDGWEECNELVEFTGDVSRQMEFRSDFCEGQNRVRNLHIVPLDVVTDYFRKNMEFLEENNVEGWG